MEEILNSTVEEDDAPTVDIDYITMLLEQRLIEFVPELIRNEDHKNI